ncbi:MAG: hypothetical protein ACRETL_08210 [Gammaproteobacteria bacterium]
MQQLLAQLQKSGPFVTTLRYAQRTIDELRELAAPVARELGRRE